METTVPLTTFEKALAAIESADCGSEPDAPSCLKYRLRPSEEAALLANKLENPPAPWGIKVNLARSFLGPVKCMMIGKKLILSKTITFLDLSMCDMQEAVAEHFFSCVRQSTSLRHLAVNGNYIGDRGAIAAAPCLGNLETFHCSSNGITDSAAIVLAAALRNSNSLKTLSIRNNRITASGIKAFIEAMTPPAESHSKDARQETGETTTEIAAPQRRGAQPLEPLMAASEVFEGAATTDLSTSTPREPTTVEPHEHFFNKSLHTLWIDQNPGTSEELLTQIAEILATRYPKPLETAKAKKSKKRS